MQLGEDFQEYLTKAPELAEELPQGLAGFFHRYVIPHPRTGARANLIMRLDEGFAPADYVPIILDIDVYKMVDFEPDSESIWDLLEELRVYKNDVFFASITEKTVRLFE